MDTAFSGLESARQALNISQEAMSVTSQNVSNASTPGYTRQRLVITEMGPGTGGDKFVTHQPSVGRGAQVSGIQQTRDNFLDMRYRSENSTKNLYEELSDSLSQIENIFNEIDDKDTPSSLSGMVQNFVSNLKKLQAAPTDTNLASTVKTSLDLICQTVKLDSSKLDTLSGQVSNTLNLAIDSSGDHQGRVNILLKNISDLNTQIVNYEITGQTANEMRDTRNNYLDELSEYCDIDVSEQTNGMVTVKLKNDSHPLVDTNNSVSYLKSNGDSIQWLSGGTANVTGGKIEAYLDILNGSGTGTGYSASFGIPTMKAKLDALALGLKATINGVVEADNPTSGQDLLQGTGASDFSLTQAWEDNDGILSSNHKGNDLGDYFGQMLNALGKTGTVTCQDVVYGGTIQAFTDSIDVSVGKKLSNISGLADSSDSIVSNLDSQRKAVSGVSINEEGIDIIKYQQSYNAASRIITTISEMLDTLINRTGV